MRIEDIKAWAAGFTDQVEPSASAIKVGTSSRQFLPKTCPVDQYGSVWILHIFSGISVASVSHQWPGHSGPHLDLAFLLPWLDQNPNDPDVHVASYSTLFQDRFPM